MFDQIRNHPELFGLIRGTCSENNIGINFANSLLDGQGELRQDTVLILKTDHFYSSNRMHNPPPAVDCLVVVRCDGNNGFDYYLIELRNTRRTASVNLSEMKKKFDTVLQDFLGSKFKDIFFADGTFVNNIKLYLVTDPLGIRNRNLSEEEIRRIFRGTVLDAYGSMPPFRFRDKVLVIEPLLPDPMIKDC